MSRGRVLWHIGILSPKHIRPGVAPIAHARGVGNTWIVNRVLLPKPVVPLKGWGTDSVDGRDVRLVCDGHSWAFWWPFFAGSAEVGACSTQLEVLQ